MPSKGKILIIGGGYTGCCAARILNDLGHEVTIFEKDARLGGLAKSYTMEGMTYEFGPHILANHACDESVIEFITQFIEVEDTSMDTASYIQGKYLNYPPNVKDIKYLKERVEIQNELSRLRPDKVDETNFETYLISKVGKTLYELYFKTFTEKFWQVDPETLDASWAKLRHLGESLTEEKMFFNENWCAYPKRNFNELFDNISKGIDVKYNTEITEVDFQNSVLGDNENNSYDGDFIISTLSIDRLFDFKYGSLDYRGYDIKPVIFEQDYYHPMNSRTGNHYSMVYYPEKKFMHTRITEYKCFNNKENDEAFNNRTIVTVETPSKTAKFYPFMDAENEKRFKLYLRELSKFTNVFSLGRMGLYKYLTIDTTTQQVFRFIKYFNNWKKMSHKERLNAYIKIRGGWNE